MLTTSAILALVDGVAQGIPIAIQTVEEIRAVNASGQEPTPEQWAAWNKAADDAADGLDAAAKAKGAS